MVKMNKWGKSFDHIFKSKRKEKMCVFIQFEKDQ